jgi:hypothetical protein
MILEKQPQYLRYLNNPDPRVLKAAEVILAQQYKKWAGTEQ